jgi:hypothetical protein
LRSACKGIGAAPWDGGGEHLGWVGCDPAKLTRGAE